MIDGTELREALDAFVKDVPFPFSMPILQSWQSPMGRHVLQSDGVVVYVPTPSALVAQLVADSQLVCMPCRDRELWVAAEEIDEVLMGNVLQAGLGQNPARQAQLAAGIPNSPRYTSPITKPTTRSPWTAT